VSQKENPPKYILNVLYNENNEIWVSRRSSTLIVMPNLWQTVCGKVEVGESAKEACIRETLEETGIQISYYRPQYIFNDAVFNCAVYITKLLPNEISKRTEPEKMSKWILVS